jgi:hypothetical protein
VHQ